MSSLPARLRLAGIRKRFGPTLALDGVSLDVNAGEVHALVGENGAGKSTLMKVLAGAHPPEAGEMWLDGAPYAPRTPLQSRTAGIMMVHQELALAPDLSVAENIVLGAEPRFGPFLRWKEIRRRAEIALDAVGRPDIGRDVRAGDLPIAEQQLVEIARAVASGCRVLVLDEPTSSLSRSDAERLFAVVRRLRGEGQAIIYISHFLEEVLDLTDRYTVLRDGRSVASGLTSQANAALLARHMVGRDVDDLYVRSPRQPGQVVLRVNAVQGSTRPRNASLELRRGEVLGIAGLIGSGRTELLRIIQGLDPVVRGTVQIGAWTGSPDVRESWIRGVGLVSEDRKQEGLALDLSIADNLTLTKLPRWVRGRQQTAAANGWRERLGLRCRDVAQPVVELSGGNQQKVALARLLHHDVDVLLLDEPTRGIDVGAKRAIYELIDRLAAQGKAVLLVSSYLPELLGMCDRIAVMCRGALGPARAVETWTEHRIMLAAAGAVEDAP